MELPKYEASRNRVYKKYISKSIKRGLSFQLTKEQFIAICTRNCHYCGRNPSPSEAVDHKKLNGSWSYNGLDRIDNSKGYLLSNVQACCFPCNRLKSNRDEKDFLSQVTSIALHLGIVCLKEEND